MLYRSNSQVRRFVSVVLLLGVGIFCGCERSADSLSAVPAPPTAETIEKSLTTVNSFIKQTGTTFEFDHAAASAAGIQASDLVIGEEIAALANDALSGKEIALERFLKFEPFFAVVAERAIDHEGQSTLKTETHCPPRVGMSVVDAKKYLLANGYHLVSSPWTSSPGIDYAKFLTTSHWPASFSPFWTYRAQGIAASDNRSIWIQQPEPNPELAAYPWAIYPGTWWGPYVAWWHRYYC